MTNPRPPIVPDEVTRAITTIAKYNALLDEITMPARAAVEEVRQLVADQLPGSQLPGSWSYMLGTPVIDEHGVKFCTPDGDVAQPQVSWRTVYDPTVRPALAKRLATTLKELA